MESKQYDVIIVGGGPAGLASAIFAARNGHKAVVLERLNSPGKKLLATGGGHCNLTNTLPLETFARNFGKQWRFTLPAFQNLNPQALRDFFSSLGVETESPDGFHVFPVSNKASDVLNALISECKKLGVEIMYGKPVKQIVVENGIITGVITDSGEMKSAKVIIACGGRSYPSLGSDGSGYRLAKFAGHKIIEPIPALVELHCSEKWPGSCAGIALKNIRIDVFPPKRTSESSVGDFLFTHSGISGPATLNISGTVSKLLHENNSTEIFVNFFPEKSTSDWMNDFELWQRKDGKKQILKIISEYLPRRLAEIFCSESDCENTEASRLSRASRENLSSMLSACRLKIKGTAGFDKAMVTRGGVSLKEINPQTMESRIVKGLYFAGEVIDVDGPCGGFNLQWAFSSGHLAGKKFSQ
jgi:predicted Rossmann fold flavoprotein